MAGNGQVEGARHVHKEELRLNMDIAIGRAPPLTDGQMQGRLRQEAHHLLAEFRDHNKQVGLHACLPACFSRVVKFKVNFPVD